MDILLYLLTGVVSGFLAGLLGIGGGLVIVPALLYILPLAGYDPQTLMQTAVGSSLAVIVFTAVSSMHAHHRAGAVDWPTVWRVAPGIVLGALIGAGLADWLSGDALRVIYLVFLLLVSAQMLLDFRLAPARASTAQGAGKTRSATEQHSLAGVVIGAFSSLVGIGGGTLSVPYLLWRGRDVRVAVATSAAIGLPIALAGALGFAMLGTGDTSGGARIGHIAWPAVLVIAPASMLLAPLGARQAHRWPRERLKRVFALLLLLIAVRIGWGLLTA